MIHDLSRRRFLSLSATSAAGATLIGLSARSPAAEGDKEDPSKDFGGLPIGIQSYSLRNFSTAEAIRHIQGLGLHFVEFFGTHFSPGSSQEEIDRMKATLREAGIVANAHGVHDFSKDHDQNRKLFEFARAAGIRNLTANPQPDAFDSLDKLVAEYDIRIAIHNHGPGALYDKLESVTKAVEGRHPLVGACVDTGHVLRSAEDPVQWIATLDKRVFALHIKDVAEQKDRTHNVVIGKGHLDVVGVFQALRKVGFPADGALSMEYEDNPENPIDDIKQCLVVAREAIAKAAC